MTIELDTTLAQAEVLFLSFTQLVADIDRRRAENDLTVSTNSNELRQRNSKSTGSGRGKSSTSSGGDEESYLERTEGRTTARTTTTTISLPTIGPNLRELLENLR